MLQGISNVTYAQNPYLAALAAQRTQAAGVSRAVTPAAAIPAAQPETPVQPVEPVRAVPATAAVQGDTDLVRRWQADPAALAGRSRMEQLGGEALTKLHDAAQQGAVPNASTQAKAAYAAAQAVGDRLENAAAKLGPTLAGLETPDVLKGIEQNGETKSAREVMEDAECETCKERKYQDGSDDPGVSFKTATHIDPGMSASAVRGHEMEHVTREQAAAEREGREVIQQTVSYRTAICPECGRAYVSGGTTRTTTAAKSDPYAVTSGKDEGGSGFSAVI